MELVQAAVKTVSLMADRRNLPAWLDLPLQERKRALTVTARTIRAAGLLLPRAARENQEITVSSPNIRKFEFIKTVLNMVKLGIKIGTIAMATYGFCPLKITDIFQLTESRLTGYDD